ncbi:MAG: DUF1549 domain-containing protein, partial [Pirellulaceae bacterium]|nr:DUF1549 domain-containing protein [Pirellulaceae bacterium]
MSLPRPLAIVAIASISAISFVFASPGNPARADELNFNRDVRPILSETCFHCHGPDGATREADLRLDQKESALSVITPGDVAASELVRRIQSADPDEKMPPADCGKTLSTKQREILVAWVKTGAPFQRHWAFTPPQRNIVVPPDSGNWSRSPIDRFVLRRARQVGMEPSPQADRETLLRRMTLDLTGLPPTPQETADFVADRSVNAVERVIDRLMNSHHYGEHMALPWLEASRYADTDGYQNDRYRHQHVWRDWVIEAYNANMPYDQFVIEQIAGDMLPDATLRQQIASGFGRNHRINSEDGSIPEE